MGYLKCKSCKGCYELQPGEKPGDFENCQCGGKLEYYDDHKRKRPYIHAYSSGRKNKKLHPLIKIAIIIGGGILLSNIFMVPVMLFLLYGSDF